MVKYLAGCGLQSCPMLLAKGYPDIGWNPCGGEKYLDFLRFAVFVNGTFEPLSLSEPIGLYGVKVLILSVCMGCVCACVKY